MADLGPERNGRDYPYLMREVKPGDPIRAREWNQIADSINRANTGTNGPINISDAAEASVFIRLFQIESIDVDTLNCIEVNTVNAGQNVQISKPFLLRGSDREHGDVIMTSITTTSRFASPSDGETVETQVIVPSYEEGDLIIAMRDISGGINLVDADGQAVEWIDMNVDARAWAKEA